MVPSKMRKRISIAIATLVALGLAAFFLWQPSQVDPEAPTGERLAQVETTDEGGVEMQGPAFDEPGRIDPPYSSRRAQPMGEVQVKNLNRTLASQEPFPHDVLMDEYKAELWADIEANPPELLERGDPAIDGELAYRLYMFYGNCSVAPRTDQHIDKRLSRITNRAQNANDRALERLEHTANQLLDHYELCMLIPPDVDPRMEAVNWMTEAVNLGHEIAQVQFYQKAMGFILRPDRYGGKPPLVMLHPGLIEEFKATARYALKQGLEKGHPEAFLSMADAIDDGIIYPRDPVLAYAYLRMAEMQAAQSQVILDRVGFYKSELANALDQAQVAEAEQLAIELRSEMNS